MVCQDLKKGSLTDTFLKYTEYYAKHMDEVQELVN